MKVAIFGLGYVGCVSAACLARLGHEVIGVDVNSEKVAQVSAGRSPVLEEGLAELIAGAVQRGTLRATGDAASAVQSADVSLVCVGTPSLANGSLDSSIVESVCEQIGQGLRGGEPGHSVVVRSTLLPGMTHRAVRPCLAAGLHAEPEEAGVTVAYNPEFLREGSALRDFFDPPFTVAGSDDAEGERVVRDLYRAVDAPLYSLKIAEAELVKYACNAFHALKITFANEIGHFSKASGVDPHKVMDVLVQDTKLNVSPAYLRPGFAFGGSCLPKDLRAILHAARQNDLELPLMRGVMASNSWQVQEALGLILRQRSRRIAVLGITFKAGTDDLRESPVVELVESLIGKGYELSIFDENVEWARLVGANRDFIEKAIPHITQLMVGSIDEAIANADVVVIGNGSPAFHEVRERATSKTIVDLVRLPGSGTSDPSADGSPSYHGVCW